MSQHTIELSASSRMRLIPSRVEDDEAVAQLRSHPETRRYLRFLPKTITVDEVRRRRESRAEDPRVIDFHILVKGNNGLFVFGGQAGIYNIDETNRSCDAGVIVSPLLHRKGIATEALYNVLEHAFEDRRIHRVGFETGSDNLPMHYILQKVLEAKLEGEKRESWKDENDGYSDVHIFSLLRREWSGGIKEKLQTLIGKNKT